jgi:hypothetical protein
MRFGEDLLARLNDTEPRCNSRPTRSSLVRQSRRALAQLVDPLRCVGLRERLVEVFASLSAQRFQVRPLRCGHRLITGLPFVGIALKTCLIRMIDV